MTASQRPFPLPRKLERDLARALTFWTKLKRRDAEMPFWDDVKLSEIPQLSDRLVMIDAFDKPNRFRVAFALIGADVVAAYGGDLAGKFLDEIEIRRPLQFIVSQCSATVESRAPTYYRHAVAGRPRGKGAAKGSYSRLLLPLWGEGRIGMLLGAFSFKE